MFSNFIYTLSDQKSSVHAALGPGKWKKNRQTDEHFNLQTELAWGRFSKKNLSLIFDLPNMMKTTLDTWSINLSAFCFTVSALFVILQSLDHIVFLLYLIFKWLNLFKLRMSVFSMISVHFFNEFRVKNKKHLFLNYQVNEQRVFSSISVMYFHSLS